MPVLSALQSLEHCPPLFFLHSEASKTEVWLPKTPRGIEELSSQLLPEVRAYKLQQATTKLQAKFNLVEGSARSQLAARVSAVLSDVEIPAIYVSVDAVEYRWNLRSSSYPARVESEVVSIADAHGGVALNPAEQSGPLKGLLQGDLEDHTLSAKDFFAQILPSASDPTVESLRQLLDISDVHIVPVRTDHMLNGFLLFGIAPEGPEREAFLQMGIRFGRLLTEAEEFDLLNQQARSMRVLQDVMLSLSATVDTHDLLDTVLDKLINVVPFDLAGIAIERDGELRLEASRGDPVVLQSLEQNDGGDGGVNAVMARLVEQKSPVLFSAGQLGIDSVSSEAMAKYGSWIGVPISWNREHLGYLFLASELAMEAIHLEISISFARQLAITLQNARLLQRSKARAERLRLVNDIGRYAISVLDPQQLVEEVASRVRDVFRYFAVRILLVEGRELVPYALRGVDGDLSVDPAQTIALEEVPEISLAIKQDEPVHLDASSSRWDQIIPRQLSGAQAVVFIPLSIVSEVIGIMEIYAQTPKALGREDVDVLQVLAAQIAISVINARLFNEISRHASELESRVEKRTQELQSQKERTEAILGSVADAILVLDLNGEVALANPPGQELLDSDQGAAVHASVRELFVAEGVVQSSIESGDVTYQALGSPVELEGEARGTVVVLRDITRLKELDQLKTQFVATVSHELRTPLTNIKLYLSLLRTADEQKQGRYHKVLVRETERLSDMIEDLLNLSRLEAQNVMDKEELELSDLLQLVADNHGPACANKGITFSTGFSQRAAVMADRTQMIQVFTNLLANAIAYTPVGGKIAFRIAGTEEIGSREFVKVVLRDTGIGIRKEDLPHVFDRFYRGAGAQKYQSEGSGLGLAIVREILDNHGAKIAVDSRPGEGTKFTVWLPALGE
jgi:two-component system phosphate regulon sensor histidine kinase PhoR